MHSAKDITPGGLRLACRLSKAAFVRLMNYEGDRGPGDSAHSACFRVVTSVLAWADTQGHGYNAVTSDEGIDALLAYFDATPTAKLLEPSDSPRWADAITIEVDDLIHQHWNRLIYYTREEGDTYENALRIIGTHEEDRP